MLSMDLMSVVYDFRLNVKVLGVLFVLGGVTHLQMH